MNVTVRRFALSIACGAILPLALSGGMVMQLESHASHVEVAVFYTLLPTLLFGLMAFAIWVLTRKPVGSIQR